MEQTPSSPGSTPQSHGQSIEVNVHSSPKLWPFLVSGAIFGALVGIIVSLLGEPSMNYTPAAAAGFFAMLFAGAGLALSAILYLVIDRVTAKRTTRKLAVAIDEDDPQEKHS